MNKDMTQVDEFLNSLGSLTQSVPTSVIQEQQTSNSQQQEFKGIMNFSPFLQNTTNSSTNQEPNNLLYTYFPCKHTTQATFQNCQFCKDCGVRMYKNGQVLALKTQQMNYQINANPIRLYKNTYQLKKPKYTMNLQEHPEYLQQREQTINYIIDLADKMRLSKSTTFLSIMFLDFLVVNDKPSQLCSLDVKDHLYIFSGVCVMLAAKSIELDEKIPFLSTLKKYLCLNQYSKDDLRRAEQKTVDILKFHLQLPTLFDLLEYYGSQGVILSNDTQKNTAYNPQQKPINFSSFQNEQPKNESAKKEQNVNNRTIELDFSGTIPSKQSQQQSEIDQNSSQNLNDNSSTQEQSSKNSNNDEQQPSSSPPSHSIPEIQPIILRDTEISPFKFYDIVQKIEKDFSKLAFYAIKDETFYEQDLEILGAACICYLREKYNISNPYRDEILQICNQDRPLVLSCSLIFLSKFDNLFKPHSYLNGSSRISPLKDIRSNIKHGLYISDNYKSATNLTTTTRVLQENKKQLFDNFDLNNYKVRDKSFEKIGLPYSSTRNALVSQQLIKNPSGSQCQRTSLFENNKTESKYNSIGSIIGNTGSQTQIPISNSSSGITSSLSSNYGSGISGLQSKLNSQSNPFNYSSSLQSNSLSTSNTLSSGISSLSSTFSKPYQLSLNQYPYKPLLSSTNSTTTNSKAASSIPNFDDEGKWNSHFTKTINSINFRANTFSSHSFLRRNKF